MPPVTRWEKGTVALPQSIHAGAPPSVPAPIPEVFKRRGTPWMSSVLVFAAAAGLTFGLVYSRGLLSTDSMPGFLKSFFPTPGLGLKLETQGDRLLLSWNRHHPAVRNSKGGLLQIDDGPRRRQVVLDAAQILNGSVLYRSTSDDVTFRLEVEAAQGGKVSETMRVLDAGKPGTLDVSAPAVNTLAPSGPPDSGMAGRSATGQIPNVPTQTTTTVIARTPSGAATDSPVINAPPVNRPSAPAGGAQPTPPPQTPLDVPVKRAEAQKQVNFDVLPETPPPTGKGEPTSATVNSSVTPNAGGNPTERAQNAPPREINTPPAAPGMAKQNAEKPNLERQSPLPAPSSAPPDNAVPKAQPSSNAFVQYRAPRPLRQVLPNTSLLSPAVLAGVGRVEVVVKVDETGHVTEARIAGGAKRISSLMTGACLLAARQWVFEPAALNGKPVPSEHAVVFQFQTPK